MNMHDNRQTIQQAVERVNDSTTLRQIVTYLIEKVVYSEAQRDILRKDNRRLRKVLKDKSTAPRFLVANPRGIVIAEYKTRPDAERFVAEATDGQHCMLYRPGDLLVVEA